MSAATPIRAVSLAAVLLGTATFAVPRAVLAEEPTKMRIDQDAFGTLADGRTVTRYRLTNKRGHFVELMDWGATLIGVHVPNRQGKLEDVTLSFPSLQGYLQRHPYYGSTVGRFCNRIAGGSFEIDGQRHTLATNNGPNHLHGGLVGFDAQLWEGTSTVGTDQLSVEFRLHSPDGQEGYPGNMDVLVRYSWNDRDELRIDYEATSDKVTHVNLTNHVYFNLGGAGSGPVTKHQLQVAADQVLDVDEGLIPTGEYRDVADTPLDFRQLHAIGERIDQLQATRGYDHCFVVQGQPGDLRTAAFVIDPVSGRTLDVLTTQPGVQLYTANHLGGDASQGGFHQYGGFCLETQHYPDAPNKPSFASTLLRPGETMHESTVYRFGVQ